MYLQRSYWDWKTNNAGSTEGVSENDDCSFMNFMKLPVVCYLAPQSSLPSLNFVGTMLHWMLTLKDLSFSSQN